MRRKKIAAILNLSEMNDTLYPLTKGRITASIPFGCRYRLIDFPFSCLSDAEITSCALFICGNGQSLYDHIRDGYVWGLDSSIGGGVFTYSQELDYNEENQINYCMRSKSEHVLVMGSKMLCNFDLNQFIDFHMEQDADLTVLYKHVNTPFNGYELMVRQNDVMHITYNNKINIANVDLSMNIAIFKTEKYLEYVNRAKELGLNQDVNIYIQFALDSKAKVKCFEYKGYLKHIDSIKNYYDANMDLLNIDNYHALYHSNHRVITRPKNGAPTYFSLESTVTNSHFASDCFIEGNVSNSIIFRKVKISKHAEVRHSIIMQQCHIGKGAILEYVILDKEVKVLPGVCLRGNKDQPLVIEKNSIVNQSVEVN